MGYCLYGNDIDDKTSPLEAGLGWITNLPKSLRRNQFLKIKSYRDWKKARGI
jgi:aminomethyltransferase